MRLPSTHQNKLKLTKLVIVYLDYPKVLLFFEIFIQPSVFRSYVLAVILAYSYYLLRCVKYFLISFL